MPNRKSIQMFRIEFCDVIFYEKILSIFSGFFFSDCLVYLHAELISLNKFHIFFL